MVFRCFLSAYLVNIYISKDNMPANSWYILSRCPLGLKRSSLHTNFVYRKKSRDSYIRTILFFLIRGRHYDDNIFGDEAYTFKLCSCNEIIRCRYMCFMFLIFLFPFKTLFVLYCRTTRFNGFFLLLFFFAYKWKWISMFFACFCTYLKDVFAFNFT